MFQKSYALILVLMFLAVEPVMARAAATDCASQTFPEAISMQIEHAVHNADANHTMAKHQDT